jgi:hypothetical protein
MSKDKIAPTETAGKKTRNGHLIPFIQCRKNVIQWVDCFDLPNRENEGDHDEKIG